GGGLTVLSFFTLSPPAGREGRVRGPCHHEETEPALLSHIERNSVAGTPLTLPSPPAHGGRGRKSGTRRDSIWSDIGLVVGGRHGDVEPALRGYPRRVVGAEQHRRRRRFDDRRAGDKLRRGQRVEAIDRRGDPILEVDPPLAAGRGG